VTIIKIDDDQLLNFLAKIPDAYFTEKYCFYHCKIIRERGEGL